MGEHYIQYRRPGDVDKTWWNENVPLFECPEHEIEQVYDYRWSLVSKHLRYADKEIGYVATEFNTMEDTWSGRYGAISCPAELQMNEIRWLRNPRYAMDNMRYWLNEKDIYAQNYSWSLGRGCEETCKVLGDWKIAEEHLNDLIEQQKRWDEGRVCYPNDRGFDRRRGMYWNTGRDSSGEFNMASCQLDEARRGIEGYKIRGGAGYRPDINANMYGNLSAIAHIAKRVSDEDTADRYAHRAEKLQERILSELWDSEREFFIHRWRYDEWAEGDPENDKSIREYSFLWETNRMRNGGTGFQPDKTGGGHGRELSTYWLWHYDLIPEDKTAIYDAAWRFLRDPRVFEAPYGPTSAEQMDPWFSVIRGECRMNGDSWPMLTSRTLTALKQTLQREKPNTYCSNSDFIDLIRTYTRTQYKNGRPFCAESHHPYKDEWTVDRQEGRHYFHSSYCDLIISGIMGLVPREDENLEIHPLIPGEWEYCALENIRYHRHNISLYWDKQGKRYGLGRGMTVIVDGQKLGTEEEAGALLLKMPESLYYEEEKKNWVDLAVNNRKTAYPKLTASVAGNGLLKYVNNGRIWYHNDPVNGWINYGSESREDWIEVDLGEKSDLREIKFAFYVNREEKVDLPEKVTFSIDHGDGQTEKICYNGQTEAYTLHCLRLCCDNVWKVRLNLRRKAESFIGVVDLEIWGEEKEG